LFLIKLSEIKIIIKKSFRANTTNEGRTVSNHDEGDSDEEENCEIKYEGYLYKITQSQKLKKLWFKLMHRDFYYYKSKEEKSHKGMHNLSGVYIKEENRFNYEGVDLFCFSVVYPKKVRNYYTNDENEHKNWIKLIHKVTGYQSLTDIYDVKVLLRSYYYCCYFYLLIETKIKKFAMLITSRDKIITTEFFYFRKNLEMENSV